jgi:Uncharacterized protein conserved in bacteria (DUF2188)
MKRIDVVKSGNQWVARAGRNQLASAPTKQQVLRATAQAARKDPADVSVRIHKVNGQIQEERTYPRRADPRRSKG